MRDVREQEQERPLVCATEAELEEGVGEEGREGAGREGLLVS